MNSFVKLLNLYPLDKITVKDIVSDCGISRNTFYYHYKDIPALLDEMVAQMADVLIEASPAENGDGSCVNNAYLLAAQNKAAVENIYHQVTIAGGNVVIGDHVELGAGAKILPNVTIGNYCHVGANAVVVEDMPDYSTCVMQKPRIIIRNEII